MILTLAFPDINASKNYGYYVLCQFCTWKTTTFYSMHETVCQLLEPVAENFSGITVNTIEKNSHTSYTFTSPDTLLKSISIFVL